MGMSPSDCTIYMITHLLSKRIAVDYFLNISGSSLAMSIDQSDLPKHESLRENIKSERGIWFDLSN